MSEQTSRPRPVVAPTGEPSTLDDLPPLLDEESKIEKTSRRPTDAGVRPKPGLEKNWRSHSHPPLPL